MLSLAQIHLRNLMILFPVLLVISACAEIHTPHSEKNLDFSDTPPSHPYGGQVWREPFADMEFVWVEGGCFEMGQSDSEKEYLFKESGGIKYDHWYGDELPLHRTCVDGFWAGKTEVTRRQFQRFIQATGYVTEAEKQGFSTIWRGTWLMKQGYHWRNVEFDQNPDHPVVHVSWNDAKAMAQWLTEHYEVFFRLPTEAEWEYACRADTESIRFWGDDPNEACEYANIADRTVLTRFTDLIIHDCDDGHMYTSPVQSFTSNGYGLFDVLGNVWEWCEDRYDKNYYGQSPRNNPMGPSHGRYRVMRGGFWGSEPSDLRCANRSREAPRGRSDTYGFRLVIVPTQHRHMQ